MISVHSLKSVVQSVPRKFNWKARTIHWRTSSVPCGYGNDLISAKLQASVCAGSVTTQQNVHDHKKLLDALVLAEVLATLHEEGVVTLVIPTNDQTFGATDGGHHLDLQGMGSKLYTEHRDFKQNLGANVIL